MHIQKTKIVWDASLQEKFPCFTHQKNNFDGDFFWKFTKKSSGAEEPISDNEPVVPEPVVPHPVVPQAVVPQSVVPQPVLPTTNQLTTPPSSIDNADANDLFSKIYENFCTRNNFLPYEDWYLKE